MIAPVFRTIERTRRCLPGAIALPAGCDAATPVAGTEPAAAVPTGFWPAGCASPVWLELVGDVWLELDVWDDCCGVGGGVVACAKVVSEVSTALKVFCCAAEGCV
jgi:hypothetical protein